MGELFFQAGGLPPWHANAGLGGIPMKKKHVICSALAAAMLLGTAVPPAGAARFPDASGHWGESAIDRWSGYGVIVGANGRFNPDDPITRGEMASILAGMLGLEETAPDHYPDLGGGWYSQAMLKCAAAGILTGDDHGRMRPYDNITGAEMAVMLVKALDLGKMGSSGSYLPSSIGYYKPWAQPYITEVASRGIPIGNDGGVFQPMQATSRAAVVSMFDRAVGTYINAPGTYTANGLTIVNTSGTVTLRGSASGVVVTGASGGVRLTLDGTRVSGPIEVRPDNVQLTLDEAQVSGDVRVMGQKARVNLNNKAKANDIILESGAHGSSVSFAKGTTAGAVTSDARNTSLSVSGTVDSIGLLAGAASAAVEVRSGGKVSSLTCDADKAAIKGSGTLKRATISGDDNKIDTRGTTVRIEKGAANTRVNGVKKNPGTTTSSGSSSSDKDDDDDRSDRYYIEYYVARDGSNDRYDYYTRERVYRGDRPDGVSTPKAPDGYKFDGWYTSRSGSKKFDFSTRIRDDYTLYGRWVKKTTTPVDPDPPKPVTKTFQQTVVLTKSDANKLDSAVWEGNTYKLAFVSGTDAAAAETALTELAGKLKDAAKIDGSTVKIADLDISTADAAAITAKIKANAAADDKTLFGNTAVTVTGTNAGTYTIVYKVAEEQKPEPVDPVVTDTVKVTVGGKVTAAAWNGTTYTITFVHDCTAEQANTALTELAGSLKAAVPEKAGNEMTVGTLKLTKDTAEADILAELKKGGAPNGSTSVTVTGTNAAAYTIVYRLATPPTPTPPADSTALADALKGSATSITLKENTTYSLTSAQVSDVTSKTVVLSTGSKLIFTDATATVTGITVSGGNAVYPKMAEAAFLAALKDGETYKPGITVAGQEITITTEDARTALSAAVGVSGIADAGTTAALTPTEGDATKATVTIADGASFNVTYNIPPASDPIT